MSRGCLRNGGRIEALEWRAECIHRCRGLLWGRDSQALQGTKGIIKKAKE